MYYTGIFILIAIFIVFQFQVKTPYFFVACLATGWFKDLHLLSPHGHRMLRADVEDVFRQAWCLEILENRGRNIGEIMMMRTVIMFYYCYYPLVNVDIAMERSTIFNGKTHYFNGHFQ